MRVDTRRLDPAVQRMESQLNVYEIPTEILQDWHQGT